MANQLNKNNKRIPKVILLVGIFQVAVGLWMIFTMAINSSWHLVIALLAMVYITLGAGLLAIMEWARFINVVVQPLILAYLLWRVVAFNEAGLGSSIQVMVTIGIYYTLTRPYIRAKFRRQPYPAER